MPLAREIRSAEYYIKQLAEASELLGALQAERRDARRLIEMKRASLYGWEDPQNDRKPTYQR